MATGITEQQLDIYFIILILFLLPTLSNSLCLPPYGLDFKKEYISVNRDSAHSE
jgi:hypothetical protein